jgi:hypothetical protein
MKPPMFISHGEWLARLEVVDAPRDAFTMRSADRLHELGFSDAPAYYLLEAPSTDDAFKLGVRERARCIEPSPEASDGDLSRWLPPEHRAAGCALASHLPAGAYWWLRSRVEPYPTDTVLMGNEYVDREPHIIELVQNPGYYAAIVSRLVGTSPVLDQPLLGVPVLNYDGTVRSGVLFFPCVNGDGRPREERLLVIPERGVMVLDAQRRFSEDDHRESLDRWANTGARGFAELLAV